MSSTLDLSEWTDQELLQAEKILTSKFIIDELLAGEIQPSLAKRLNSVMSANGHLYTHEVKGHLPTILQDMYDERVKAKRAMLDAARRYEETKDKKYKLEEARWKNVDKASKVQLNSAYGVLTNQYFLFYDHANAEAITTSGQLAIKWVEKKVNDWMNSTLKTMGVDYIIAMDTDSVRGDSIVRINGEKMTIKSFFDIAGDDYIRKDDEKKNWVKRIEGYKTLSLSRDGIIREKNVNYVMKHRVKKRLFEISVGEKTVVVTEDHSIIARDLETGEIISISPNRLNINRHRLISIEESDIATENDERSS